MSPARTVSAYIGLGSNLEDPIAQVSRALTELADPALGSIVAASSMYRTPPMGPPGQPDYINAVARLETSLEPLALLAALQGIEQAHRRVRAERWGPRTLDLDLLVYGDEVIDLPVLKLPHPGISQRAFVLVPLAEVAPMDLVIAGQGRLEELLAHCDRAGMQPLEARLV